MIYERFKMCFAFEGVTDFVSVMLIIHKTVYFVIMSRGHFKLINSFASNDSIWWKINGDKKAREMEFLSRQTFACIEDVSVLTERQTDKIGNDILETLENVTVCTYSLKINHYITQSRS
jgi:hypothetical protein